MTIALSAPKAKHTRTDDVLRTICLYARENSCLPTTRQIAEALHLSQQRVAYLMMRLELKGKIKWMTRYTYQVVDSTWEPPPGVDI